MPGRYILSLFSANYGHIYHDVLPNCLALEVQPSNRYGLNRGMTQNPIVMLDCSWEMGVWHTASIPQRKTAALAGSRG
jgi:hypothetical protein